MTDDVLEPETAATRVTSRVFSVTEDVLYALVAIILVGGAVIVLGQSVYALVTHADDGVRTAIEDMLDSLLIVFILVELLSAVRATIVQRHLVAEPFLLVGIIASIKEIVVIGAFAEENQEIGETMLQVGVLAGVVLLLSVASLLLRRKEREPAE